MARNVPDASTSLVSTDYTGKILCRGQPKYARRRQSIISGSSFEASYDKRNSYILVLVVRKKMVSYSFQKYSYYFEFILEKTVKGENMLLCSMRRTYFQYRRLARRLGLLLHGAVWMLNRTSLRPEPGVPKHRRENV